MKEEYTQLMNALSSGEKPDPAIEEFLTAAVNRKALTGKPTLQRKEGVPEYIFFIIEGIARLCFSYTDGDARVHKITSAFVREGDFAFTPDSFFTQTPSLRSIELIGDGKVFAISYETVKAASARFLEMPAILESLKDRYYQHLKERSYVLGLPLVKDRYDYLTAHKPWLFDRAPMEHIATFIGTTRETLTRTRSRYERYHKDRQKNRQECDGYHIRLKTVTDITVPPEKHALPSFYERDNANNRDLLQVQYNEALANYQEIC